MSLDSPKESPHVTQLVGTNYENVLGGLFRGNCDRSSDFHRESPSLHVVWVTQLVPNFSMWKDKNLFVSQKLFVSLDDKTRVLSIN